MLGCGAKGVHGAGASQGPSRAGPESQAPEGSQLLLSVLCALKVSSLK